MRDPRPTTIAQLRASGHVRETVKQELRRNLLAKLRSGQELFPGIVGYDETVVPQICNAVISGHDLIMLGERGQAKSRIMRSLIVLLDETVPVLAGCEINDHPYAAICRHCRDMIAQCGDEAPVEWLPRDRRYGEKLATPDISIADLIGEVDPIKVAEGRYLADELTIHYGLVPRTNRGVFAINELPDLAERIQVGLLNIMEEKDVQIRGYRIRLPLDLMVVASANPEDYTSRGRIITPLKDRFGSQVRTHYPMAVMEEIQIMEAEGSQPPGDVEVLVPPFMKEIVAEMTHLARRSPHISQSSGVSVRMSIGNYENLTSNAVRRAVRWLGEEIRRIDRYMVRSLGVDLVDQSRCGPQLGQIHVGLDVVLQRIQQAEELGDRADTDDFVLNRGQHLLLAAGTSEVVVGVALTDVNQGLVAVEMLRPGVTERASG